MIAQLTKIKAARPDAVILYTAGAPVIVVAKNQQQLGMEQIPFVVSHGINYSEVAKLAGNAIEKSRWIFLSPKHLTASKLPPTTLTVRHL